MTYSIVARDPETGELGIAVQSRSFAAGLVVPFIAEGIGVVASQSFTNPRFGPEGIRLLRSGLEPQAVLDRLLREDPGRASRQVAVMDAAGHIAVHTGAGCVAEAGHTVRQDCCALANMMARPTVWKAMADAFEAAGGALADRLLAALDAAEREGGDLRGRQSAALTVAWPARLVASQSLRPVDLRVDDHPDPVGEIRRLLRYSRAYRRAGGALGKALGGDYAGALADLDACCAAYPDEPEFLFRRGLALLGLGHFDEARDALRRAHVVNPGWSELLLRFADADVIPVGREVLEHLVASLAADDGPGPHADPGL